MHSRVGGDEGAQVAAADGAHPDRGDGASRASARPRVEVGGRSVPLAPELVVIAGFSGRDEHEVAEHVAELKAAGVPAPAGCPCFWAASPAVVDQSGQVTVLHGQTSGEAEAAIVVDGDRRLVTLASDHTDRRAEAVDFALAKQACVKPLATEAWSFEEVADHWDRLLIRSWIREGEAAGRDGLVLYQDGCLSDILPPSDLLSRLADAGLPESFILLCGTVPALGGIRGGSEFVAELHDPVLGRTIGLSYRVRLRTLDA